MCIQAAHSSAQGYSGEFRLAPEPPFPPCDDVPIRAAATHPHLPLETSLHEVHAAQRETMSSVCAACWRRTRPASGCRRLSRVYRCVGGRPALPSSQFHHPARLPLGVGSVPVSPGWIGGAGLYASSMSLPLASVSPVRIERAYRASRGFVRRGHFSRESLSM